MSDRFYTVDRGGRPILINRPYINNEEYSIYPYNPGKVPMAGLYDTPRGVGLFDHTQRRDCPPSRWSRR